MASVRLMQRAVEADPTSPQGSVTFIPATEPMGDHSYEVGCTCGHVESGIGSFKRADRALGIHLAMHRHPSGRDQWRR